MKKMLRIKKGKAAVLAASLMAMTLVPFGSALADGTCQVNVTSNPRQESGQVYGAGSITCSSSHTITVTVKVQRQGGDGTWDTRGTTTNQNTGTSAGATAISPSCQNGTWRTRVDGFTNHFSLGAVIGSSVTVSC